MTVEKIRQQQWVERIVRLYNGLTHLRNEYPESLHWSEPILDTLNFIIFEERPSQNDWIEMALSSFRDDPKIDARIGAKTNE